MAAVDSSLKFLNYTLNILALFVVGAFLLALYWVFEPDPLEVNYINGSNNWSTCVERRYALIREVKSHKDLTVHIKEYWWDIDGMRDINGKIREYPHKPVTTYTLSAGTDRIFDFPKHVPKDLDVGRYRYRPHAEYKINHLKTIRRDLPVQYVNVACEYDVKKHGVMQ
jgi:hypothetical protein